MPQAFPYIRVTSTGSNTLSISQGMILHAIVLNQQSTVAATSTANQATVYDATTNSGKVVGVIQLNNAGVGDYLYDIVLTNGLTLQVGTAASPVDITISGTF